VSEKASAEGGKAAASPSQAASSGSAASGKPKAPGAESPGGIPDLDLRRQEDGPGKPSAAPPPAEEGAFDKLLNPDPPAQPGRKP
jgi:hypothetical protein